MAVTKTVYCILALGCAALEAPQVRWPRLPNGYFMWVGAFLQVTGTGLPPDPDGSETQRRGDARDAAITDAWTRLRGYIEALTLDDGRTVGEASEASPEMNSKIHILVTSAAIVNTVFDGERALVSLRLEKGRINKILGTEFR